MGDFLEMSSRDRSRLVELEAVRRGAQSLVSAATRLRVSYRQAKRLWRRFEQEQAAGLIHRSRGRPSNRAKSLAFRESCLAMYREKLTGFGPTLAAEKLATWGFTVHHETLRRWLTAAELWKARGRKICARKWRPRRKRFGEMLQLDGSFHDWFERGDGQRDCLTAMIDDATGRRMSHLDEQETTFGVMSLLNRWIERYGIPHSLYVDGKNVYTTDREPTLDEQLAEEIPRTALGKACQRLGIEIIVAHSPQAKGRIERSHAVYQDRLVKEIQLLGLTTREQVNELLEGFDDDLDRRFAVSAQEAEDAHRAVPADLDLATVWGKEEIRTLGQDWTLRYQNRWFQVLGPSSKMPPAKSQIRVQSRLDGSLHLYHRNLTLEFEELAQRPTPPPKGPAAPRPSPPRAPIRPASNHPWRQPWKRRAAAPAPHPPQP